MEIKKIESFKINHITLQRGLYVSRRDRKDGACATTFDLRMTLPNRESPASTAAMHTVEHLGATFLRSCARADDVIYFGPMGCRTGFYLVMFGEPDPKDVYPLVSEMCDFILGFSGPVPGATKEECGNYSDQDLDAAKKLIRAYKSDLEKYKRFSYGD